MLIDHVSYPVPFSKVDDEVNFLLAACAHMGIHECMRPVPGVVGMGDTAPWLWIGGLEENHQPIPDDAKLGRTHLALSAKGMFFSPNVPLNQSLHSFSLTHHFSGHSDRGQVDAFHAAALKAGGTCNGPPGLRPQYHANYYGAFVISPAGHNIEVVTHCPDA